MTPGTIATSSARQACGPASICLAHRRRHGEHAGIAARDQRDLRALRRVAQRRRGARALLAVVGGVARLARPRAERDRDRGRSRRARRRRRAPPPPPASASAHRPGRGRPRRAARSRPSLPARHQHDGEIRRVVVAPWRRAASSPRPPWCRARHRSRASSRPAAAERAAHLGEMAAELHHHGRVGVGEAALELGLRQRARAAR